MCNYAVLWEDKADRERRGTEACALGGVAAPPTVRQYGARERPARMTPKPMNRPRSASPPSDFFATGAAEVFTESCARWA